MIMSNNRSLLGLLSQLILFRFATGTKYNTVVMYMASHDVTAEMSAGTSTGSYSLTSPNHV